MSLTVAGSRVYYRDEGSGPPISFFHGNPDSADLWSGVIERLQGNCATLALDLPGFGRSAAPPTFDGSLEQEAAWVDGVVLALGISEPINLVARLRRALRPGLGHLPPGQSALHCPLEYQLLLGLQNGIAWGGRYAAIVGEIVMALMNESGLVRGLRDAAPV